MKRTILQKLRIESGKTQEQVAEELGVVIGTVQNWEKTLRFKSHNDLHDLLDLYDIDDLTRCEIVQQIYGKYTCISESELINQIQASFPSLHSLSQTNCSLDFFTECLQAFENRMHCLECTITYCTHYANNFCCPIFALKTAKIIDSITAEYNTVVNAEHNYYIDKLNENLATKYVFNDSNSSIFIEEYNKMMTSDEYIEAFCAELKDCSTFSTKEQVAEAVQQMQAEYAKLYNAKQHLLKYIAYKYASTDLIDIKYMIQKDELLIWANLHILPASKTYRITMTTDAINNVLASDIYTIILSSCKDDEINKSKNDYVYCSANYVDIELAESIINKLSQVLLLHRRPLITKEGWKDVCHSNQALKDYINHNSSGRG